MNFKLIIDKEREEEVIVYAHKKTEIIEEIEQLVNTENEQLLGFSEREIIPITLSQVNCFITEDNKIFALTADNKLKVKTRLYKLEEKLPEAFVKINQSCIANIRMIERFDASFSGSLTVKFKNGYTDYVSRRNVKNIKERLGLK